jgi:carboxyl-terminal processing protease
MINKLKNISKKTKMWVLIVAIGISSFASISFVDDYFEISKNVDIFVTLYRELNLYYVDETKPGDLMKKGIDGMLQSLDPFTVYIPESKIEDFRFQTTGEYGGIGSLIVKRDEYIMISEPYEGFPADNAGLKAGDIITEVNGKSIKGKSTEDVSKVLKGQANTTVKVTIKRPGQDKPIEKEITRMEVKVPSVPHYEMLDDSTAYIRLTSFTDRCAKEVENAFKELQEENDVKALVLDLRDNPGGLLKEAVSLCNLFVEKGETIVSTKGKVKDWSKNYVAKDLPMDKDIPLAILVNSGSASASEIVSGTMQDLDRGVILGQKTYGKGLVQTTRPLSYGSQLKVTTAKYYIPSGRCIQAVDYSHRREDGSVGKIPDSLMTKFETRNGRPVYDGGGIMPDIELEEKYASDILGALVRKFLIFDYATKFEQENDSIAPPKEFELTHKIYQDFLDYIADKELDYSTDSEKMAEKFEEVAKEDKYYDLIKEEFEALKSKLEHNKNEDLKLFREEIEETLKYEIVTRYYYRDGRLKSMLSNDEQVQEALKYLRDREKYNAILQGTYADRDTKK